MTAPVIQITRNGLLLPESTEAQARIRKTFDEQHCLRLERLFEPDLCAELVRKIADADFEELRHDHIGVELHLADRVTSEWLNLLVNDAALFRFVEEITGCDRIASFFGRVYKLTPDPDHYDSWHDDLAPDRMIAMSVNFSSAPYEGGLLQIRDARTKQMLAELANPGRGDAVLFRVAAGLEHQVTPVQGAAPRTALAGWFCSGPDYYDWLLSRLQLGLQQP